MSRLVCNEPNLNADTPATRAYREALTLESVYAMPSRCVCNGPGERGYFILGVVFAMLGWGVFFAAAVFSSLYPDTRHMQGYEWIPGILIVPLAWVGFCRWPATSVGQGAVFSSPDERQANEGAINLRIGYIIIMVMAGVIMAGIFIVVGWFVPPNLVSDSVETRRLHVSPSPAPTHASSNDVADPVTGTLLAVHIALLVGTVVFQWLAVTTPSPTEHDDLPMDQL